MRVTAVLAICCLSACGGGNSDSGPIVFVGDSITALWGKPAAANPTITELVPGSVDVGDPGWTSVQIAGSFKEEVLALHPSVVVIEAGTNDVIYLKNPTADAISTMAEEAAAGGARVLLADIPPTSIPQYGVTAGDIAAFNEQIRALCDPYGYTFVNYQSALELPSGAQNPADFDADGIHPNSAGFQAMWIVLQAALAGT